MGFDHEHSLPESIDFYRIKKDAFTISGAHAATEQYPPEELSSEETHLLSKESTQNNLAGITLAIVTHDPSEYGHLLPEGNPGNTAEKTEGDDSKRAGKTSNPDMPMRDAQAQDPDGTYDF